MNPSGLLLGRYGEQGGLRLLTTGGVGQHRAFPRDAIEIGLRARAQSELLRIGRARATRYTEGNQNPKGRGIRIFLPHERVCCRLCAKRLPVPITGI
jgi:hypothetical protein